MHVCIFIYKISIWIFVRLFPVTLMTVKDNTHLSSAHPDLSEEMGGAAMITVSDRKAEIMLMDKDIGSCITDEEQRYQFLHLIGYIYTPFLANDLRVIFLVSGLACTDSRLIVYYQMNQDSIPYRQCVLVTTESLPGTIWSCEFSCYYMCPIASVVKVHVRVQNLLHMSEPATKICEMSLGWANFIQ